MLEDLEEKRSQSSQQPHHLPAGFPGLRMSRSYHGYHGSRASHFGGGVSSHTGGAGGPGKLGDSHPLEGTRLLRASTSPHVVAPTHSSLSHLCPTSSRNNNTRSHIQAVSTPTSSTYYSYSPATVSTTSTSTVRAPRRPEQHAQQQQQRQQRNHHHHFHLPHPRAKSQSYECVPLVAKQNRHHESGHSSKSRARNHTTSRGYSFPSLPLVRSGPPIAREDSFPSPSADHSNALSYPDLVKQVETVI